MCPQIWAFGTGHNLHLNQSSQSSVASASGAGVHNSFLLSCFPIGTTGGDSRLNKILFKFYCILIWTYKKKHNKQTFTSWIVSLCPCYLMHYYNKRCHYKNDQMLSSLRLPNNLQTYLAQFHRSNLHHLSSLTIRPRKSLRDPLK